MGIPAAEIICSQGFLREAALRNCARAFRYLRKTFAACEAPCGALKGYMECGKSHAYLKN